jgi:peroxiredoxin
MESQQGSRFVKYVIVTVLVATAASYIYARRNFLPALYAHRGSEFNHPEDANQSWAGPPVGERIDLTRLKNAHGMPLSAAIADGFSMIVLVDPGCAAAQAASDQLKLVREAVTKVGVHYYLVSVTSSVSSAEFDEYAHSLASDAPAYLWSQNEATPSQQLYGMVLPSHILIDRRGSIVHKWPGTDVSADVRERMAKEIIADTIAELNRRRESI